MKALSWIFFFGYVGSLFVFGGLGTFTARSNHGLLFRFDPSQLEQQTVASLLSSPVRFFISSSGSSPSATP